MPRLIVLFALGFASGLPVLLTSQTLQAWLTDARVSVDDIARFAAVGLPYTFKFAWAPLFDRFRLPFLGRRRGWILVFQLATAGALTVASFVDPRASLIELALALLVVATLSASLDTVIDAYNADLLAPEERAVGSASYVMGYRAALLVAGSLALVAADHVVWSAIYQTIAGLLALSTIATVFAEEPPAPEGEPCTIASAIALPFVELFRRLGWRGAIYLLAFAALYKFGEQFAQVLLVTFFRETGFSNTEIGLVTKGVGFVAWAAGGAIGGILVKRHGVERMLVPFAIAMALTHAAYLGVALIGKDLVAFAIAIFVDNLTYAMATSAFVAALMGSCAPAVSATQFALLTSLASLGQRVFGPFAGEIVERAGWPAFFYVTIAVSIPAIAISSSRGLRSALACEPRPTA